MALVAHSGVNGRQIPDGDGELGVGGQCAVFDGQAEPLVPHSPIPEVPVRRLRMNGKRLRIGKGLHGDIELEIRAQIAAAVAQVGSLEKGRVGQRLLVSLQAVSTHHERVSTAPPVSSSADAHISSDFISKINPHLHSHEQLQL